MNTSSFNEYGSFLSETQELVKRLEADHAANLKCRAGCYSCCVNLSVFKVEFDYITKQIKKAGLKLSFDTNLSCGFLKNGLCSIYLFRPMICRTHGMPVIYLDNNKKWQVDFCPENFTVAGSHLFNRDNTLNLELFNLKLYQINQNYCLANGYNPEERIELHQLITAAGEL